MESSVVFETFTVLRKDLLKWPMILGPIATMIKKSEIKVVDIKKSKDRLTIVYRRIS